MYRAVEEFSIARGYLLEDLPGFFEGRLRDLQVFPGYSISLRGFPGVAEDFSWVEETELVLGALPLCYIELAGSWELYQRKAAPRFAVTSSV